MGILSGIVSYIFGLTLNLLDSAIDGFLGALGFDLDTFETFFPAAKDYYDVIAGFGIGLLFIMLIFQIFRNFGIVLEIEAEDPLKMLGKTALFYGMIVSSRSITNLILNLLSDPYAIFLGAASDPYEFKLMTLAISMFTSVFSNPFMSIVALILMLVLGWQFLKLTIECVERYIVFCVVLYIAPVVFATGAFKSTAQIFKSWCRMLGSQALLLLLNIWSIKLFLSYLPVLESGSDQLVFNFLIGYAFLKFAQKADTLLRILGLNTASTGDMVRSLGGTVASVAFAFKSMSGMAGTAATAIGKILGGAGNSVGGASAGAAAGGEARSAAGGAVSGISRFAGGTSDSTAMGAPDTAAPCASGVTVSEMNAAKQGYVNDVLSSANAQIRPLAQMQGNQPRGGYDSTEGFDSNGKLDGHDHADASGTEGGNIKMHNSVSANAEMQPDGTRSSSNSNPRVAPETREGLANLAHGIPHNQYDPIKKTYAGGGFPEFTGANANMIGASQLTPADGFEQHGVKMRNGSTGTLYQNTETGEAHLVQFGSVDNGVIQGSISEVNKATGQFGDFMAFKAVHESVPGAESFSGHSVPVSDSEGGVYHVSTGAATSFFASGASGSMKGAAGYSAPAQGAVSPANAPYAAPGVSAPTPSSGMGGESVSHTGVSAHDTSTIHTSSIGTPAAPSAAAPSGAASTSVPTPPTGSGIPAQGAPGIFHDSVQPVSGAPGMSAANENAGSTSIIHESMQIPAPGAARPQTGAKTRLSPEETQRFSKHDPGDIAAFGHSASGAAACNPDIPKMNPNK